MNLGQPSAGALGTAVDRMSFAHDIVMMTESTIAVGIGSTDQHQVQNFQFFEDTILKKKFNLFPLTHRMEKKYIKIHYVN